MGFLDIIKTLDMDECGLVCLSDDELKKIQSIYVEMLKELSGICENNGIDWTLSAGNVLGAVRHKGFIPWDDDLDISMSRSDFIKFKRALTNAGSKMLHLKVPGDKDYIFHFPRLYNDAVCIRGLQSTDKCETGLPIDIHISENIPDNKLLRYIHGFQCTAMLAIVAFVRTKVCSETLIAHSGGSREFIKAVKKRSMLGSLFGFLPIEKWTAMADKCFSKIKDDSTRDVSMPSGRKHYFGEIYRREDVCRSKKAIYEGVEANIPFGSDNYLRSLYGDDYMTPPPEEHREKHPFVEFTLSKDTS